MRGIVVWYSLGFRIRKAHTKEKNISVVSLVGIFDEERQPIMHSGSWQRLKEHTLTHTHTYNKTMSPGCERESHLFVKVYVIFLFAFFFLYFSQPLVFELLSCFFFFFLVVAFWLLLLLSHSPFHLLIYISNFDILCQDFSYFGCWFDFLVRRPFNTCVRPDLFNKICRYLRERWNFSSHVFGKTKQVVVLSVCVPSVCAVLCARRNV